MAAVREFYFDAVCLRVFQHWRGSFCLLCFLCFFSCHQFQFKATLGGNLKKRAKFELREDTDPQTSSQFSRRHVCATQFRFPVFTQLRLPDGCPSNRYPRQW